MPGECPAAHSVPRLSLCSPGRRWNSCEVTTPGACQGSSSSQGNQWRENFSSPAASIPWGLGLQAAINLKTASAMATKQNWDVLWHSETVTQQGRSNLWDKAEPEAAKNAKWRNRVRGEISGLKWSGKRQNIEDMLAKQRTVTVLNKVLQIFTSKYCPWLEVRQRLKVEIWFAQQSKHKQVRFFSPPL